MPGIAGYDGICPWSDEWQWTVQKGGGGKTDAKCIAAAVQGDGGIFQGHE